MSATIHDLTLRLRPRFDENAGPVVWCQHCAGERVQFDWRKDLQLCPSCTRNSEAGPEPRPAA